jgi:hypothetical protein
MRVRRLSAAVFLVATLGFAEALGTFRGTIVDPPQKSAKDKGWIYVQGRNQMLRRVSVAQAKVVYGPDVPLPLRHPQPAAALADGTEVRVTATQDVSGEWRATEVEILKLAPEQTRFSRAKL